MDSPDAIIIGSGAGGAWTARGLRGLRVLVLDVGNGPSVTPEAAIADEASSLADLRARMPDLFDVTVGRGFEGLHDLHAGPISPKLKAPLMHWVVKDAARLAPIVATDFDPVASLALGGLANAWGAGAYRFDARDLEGFPLRVDDLRACYDEVSAEIGICGADDDLSSSFGVEPTLLPPLATSRFASTMLAAWARRRERLMAAGLRMGRSRLALLTRPHGGRPAHDHANLEFVRPQDASIYSPALTMRSMIAAGEIGYRPSLLVTRWRETSEGVEVFARHVETGAEERFTARSLFLAAGAVNSARLALASAGDVTSRLPLLDNPLSQMPLVRWRDLGAGPDPLDSSLAQLNFTYDDPMTGALLQGSVFRATGLLRSDVLRQYPLAIMSAVAADTVLAPAMGVVFLFHAASSGGVASLRLRPTGEVEIAGVPRVRTGSEARLARHFRALGFWTSERLCRFPPLGTGVHYAGTLPMRANPGRHETGPDGRLAGTRRVWVTDGACFSALPAKNLTFTIMANALRIARLARRELGG